MELELSKKYILKSDRYNFWIAEKRTVKKGKTAGEDAEVVVCGYHNRLENLCASFVQKEIREAEAKAVEEYLEAISKAERKAMSVIRKINKEANRMLKEQRSK